MEGPEGKEEFVFCGACGTRLDASVRFCTSCGASQAPFEESGGGDRREEAGTTGNAPSAPTGLTGGEAAADAPTEAMAGGAGGQGPPPLPTGLGAGAQPGGQRGFFEALFDIKFEHLITPKLVRFFYALSIIVLAIGVIGTIIAAAQVDETTAVIFLFLAPLTALVYLIMIRLWLELIVVAFKIRDGVERVAENTERPE